MGFYVNVKVRGIPTVARISRSAWEEALKDLPRYEIVDVKIVPLERVRGDKRGSEATTT